MANVEYKIEEEAPRSKNRMVLFVALLAIVVLVAGGTLAYLTTTTNTESNVFTSGNIKAELIEAAWTPAETPDGTSGSEIAANMLPGVIAPKDPVIKNTSGVDINEWVGIMLTFEKPTSVTDGVVDGWTTMSEDEVAALLTGVGIDDATSGVLSAGLAINSNWARIDTASGVTAKPGQWVYACGEVIPDDDSTDALFQRVGILAAAGSEDWNSTDHDLSDVTLANFMTWLNSADGLNGHYRITISGAAVQDDGVQSDANSAILGLFNFSIS